MNSAPWQWHPNRVLVVDDDKELTDLFQSALQKKGGYEVVVANTLSKAMEVLDLFQPGFIILDMQLDPRRGDVTSWPILKKIRHPVQLPVHVIVVTGQNQKYPQNEVFLSGGDNYFSKPVDTDILMAYMHRVRERQTLTNSTQRKQIPIPAGTLDLDTMKIYYTDRTQGVLSIPKMVARLIEILVNAYPNEVARQDLVRMLWPAAQDIAEQPAEGTLRNLVHRAREYLGSSTAIEVSLRDSSWYRWGSPLPDPDKLHDEGKEQTAAR